MRPKFLSIVIAALIFTGLGGLQAKPLTGGDDFNPQTIMSHQKILSYEAACAMIDKGGFGFYKLYSLVGGELLAGSHLTSEEQVQMSTADLLVDLQSNIDQLGYGRYKLLLKRNPKSTDSTQVTYRFEYAGDPVDQQANLSGLQGAQGAMSLQQFREELRKDLEREMSHERAKFDFEKKIWLLEKKIEELKVAQQPPAWLQGANDTGKMIAGIILAKVAPEAIPAVNQMLGVPSEQDTAPSQNGTAQPATDFKRTD